MGIPSAKLPKHEYLFKLHAFECQDASFSFFIGIFNYLKIQLKSSQLAVFYLDTHGLAGPADFHFMDFKPGCDIPCAFAR